MSSSKFPDKAADPSSPAAIPPRERIVSSAADLFRKFGIRGIGVDAIAEAAQTNKMTLYRKFGSKDELLCATLRQVTQRAGAIWDELERDFSGDAAAQLKRWVEFQVERLEQEPGGCDLANAAVELRDSDHPAHAVVQEFKNSQRDRLASVCEAAGSSDPQLLADTLSLLLEGARVSVQTSGPEGSSRRFRESCEATIAAFSSK
ncbi:TetR/AcrR family transcriptional regulator [Neorhizobium galegae]|uniref:TetR/AcrR family transcriptional regulator n=1 Tax=Neorhizobium galegae TaxID=399 RepID=UPI002100A015|nr:TetR/AcrR family transcriptional regulator [Neorhizobium galegae]MCQ1574945.1 TetR/AcrR family transcriptional regulator [Neorhizobium galegae]MCQ1839441.1 TetR/AcrR family transcriptional regulator [Neorhizobium galegae]